MKYERHIFIDHGTRTISIQVQHDLKGYLIRAEFDRMNAGLIWEYIPVELVADVRSGIDSGYLVRPVACVGAKDPEAYIVYQVMPLTKELGDMPLFKMGQ